MAWRGVLSRPPAGFPALSHPTHINKTLYTGANNLGGGRGYKVQGPPHFSQRGDFDTGTEYNKRKNSIPNISRYSKHVISSSLCFVNRLIKYRYGIRFRIR